MFVNLLIANVGKTRNSQLIDTRNYRKSGNFRCKNIFVVDRSYEIKITKIKRMRMLQCGTGSFLRKYFYTKFFPTKISLRENFWIYGKTCPMV